MLSSSPRASEILETTIFQLMAMSALQTTRIRQLRHSGTRGMEDRRSLFERIWQRWDNVVKQQCPGLVVPRDAITLNLQLAGQPVQSKLTTRCPLRDNVRLVTRCN